MTEVVPIDTVVIHIRAGKDVTLTYSEFEFDVVGYTWAGAVYLADGDTKLTGSDLTFDTTQAASKILTVRLPKAITATMTTKGEAYYSYIDFTDTATLDDTLQRVIWKVV
jgi:hypothetical protein